LSAFVDASGPTQSNGFVARLIEGRPSTSAAFGFSVAAVLGAAVVGVLTGSLVLASIVLIGGFVLPMVVTEPWWALVMVTVVQLTHTEDVLADQGVEGVYVATLALGLLSLGLGVCRRRVRLVWSPVFLAAALFLAARALAAFAARDPGVAMEQVVETVAELLFFVVFTTLLASTAKYVRLVQLTIVVLAGLSALTAVQEFVLDNSTTFAGYANVLLSPDLGAATSRHSGPQTDPNFWARTLVLFVPLALSLWAHRSTWLRWMWLGMAVTVCSGIYLTESRGGFIALALVIAIWTMLSGKLLKFVLIVPILAVALTVLPGVGSRLATLSDIDDAAAGAGDLSLVGRVQAARAGTAVFLDHPVLGVGPGNFVLVIGDYVERPPAGLGPHNVYIEIAAEEGIIGELAWLLLLGTALFVAIRALILSRQLAPGAADCWGRLLSLGVIAGLLGWAFASLFLGLAYFKILLIVIGLGTALDIEATKEATTRMVAARRMTTEDSHVRSRR